MGLFAPKNSAPAPIRYTGLNVSTSQFDLPIPIFWGQRRLSTNAIWYNNFKAHSIGPKGKGGGGKNSQQQYDYTASTIVALCEGVIDSIANIWAQGSTTTTTTLSALNQTFFDGTATQTPWSYVVTNFPSQAQAYARTAYLGCPKMDLGSSASIPDNQYECVRANGFSYAPSSPGWINPNTHVQASAIDCLPPDILVDFLTNVRYGMGFAGAGTDIDSTSLAQYAAYCRAQGILFSPLLNAQEKATQVVDRWAQLSNTWIYWNGTAVAFVPLGDTALAANGASYTPNTSIVYALGLADFLGEVPVTVERKDPADCYNRTRLDITDRTVGYVTNPFEYKDQTLVDEFGLRDQSSVQADEICNPQVAQIVVQLVGKRAAYIRNTYKFKTSYRYILLLPGDIVTLSEPNIGLGSLPVRITAVSEDGDTLSFTAEEFPGAIGTYYAATASLATAPTVPDQYAVPSSVNTPAIVEPNSSYTGGKAVLVIAASGTTNWGGAEVNISFDGTDYSFIGSIEAPAIQGALTAGLAAFAGTNPDTVHTLAVDCTESGIAPSVVTNADAEAARSLCLVAAQPSVVGGIAVVPANGELLAFGANTATGTFTANLSFLERGLYGTAASAHAAGDQFTMIDVLGVSETSLSFALPPQYIGSTIYLKLCSFNPFGNALEDIASVVEYQYTPSGAGFGSGAGGVPAVPAGFAAVAGIQSVQLSWNANAAADNVGEYEIYRASGTGAAFSSASLVAVTPSLNYTDVGLAQNAGYTYFLEAVNAVGASGHTAGTGATTSPLAIGGASASITASENIAAGALVNLWNNAGAINMRNANATDLTKPAHGFVLASVSSGAAGTFLGPGQIDLGLTGLTPGALYYLAATAGAVTATAPSSSGNAVLPVGIALSASALLFQPGIGAEIGI